MFRFLFVPWDDRRRPMLVYTADHFGRPFVKPFALCYWTVACLSCPICPVCPVCDVGVLRRNGWMDQDATWYGGRPRPRLHKYIVLDGTHQLPPKGHRPPFLAHMLWPNGWMDQDATWYGYGHIVLDGDSAHPERGTTPPFSARVHVL